LTPAGSDSSRETPDWMQQKERGNIFWLRVMSRLSQILGRRGSRPLLYGISLYFLLFSPRLRTASRSFLTRCLQRPATWRDIYRQILYFASTVHDRCYLLQEQFERFEISQTGTEELHQHFGRQQGLLLFGAHLGSFEALRATASLGPTLNMSMAMYPENARQINRALNAINPGATRDIIALGTLDAMLTVHRRLQEGAMVGILADRASGPDQYRQIPFLGRPAAFPTGPFRMAAMLGHPVYFMAGLYLGANRYRIHFELLEDWSSPDKPSRQEAANTLMAKYAAALERQCRAHPYNWFNFYDFWKEH
jgi:predicted LPLAT superfamily acyltransferase